MTPDTTTSNEALLQRYWAAHAQFGPFDITPELHLKMVRAGTPTRDDYERQLLSLISTQEGKIEAARKIVARFSHDEMCCYPNGPDEFNPCNCGLAEALAALGGTEK